MRSPRAHAREPRIPHARGALETLIRQLAFVEPGRVEWQEAPGAALPGPAGALVRPLAVARCDLDLPMAMAGSFPGPFPVGRETVAAVMVVGDEVGHASPTTVFPWDDAPTAWREPATKPVLAR